jgi:tetratricopeptide (TPR) repeat protein
MKFTDRFVVLIALLALVAAAPLAAQQQGQQQPPPKQPGQTQTPPAKQPGQLPTDQPAAPPLNKEEEDAYKLFLDAKDDTLRVKLGEDFLQKFPETRYREYTLSRLARSYQNTGQEEKMFSAGSKVLTINPDNIDMLAMMAELMPRRVDTKSLDAAQKLQTAERYARRVQELVPLLAKPETMLDEEFTKAKNEVLSQSHSGLGVVFLLRGKAADAAAEFEQVTKLSANPSEVDYYLLALALEASNRFADASAAYAHCAEKPGSLQAGCKQKVDETKKKADAPPPAPKP